MGRDMFSRICRAISRLRTRSYADGMTKDSEQRGQRRNSLQFAIMARIRRLSEAR